MKIRIAIIGLGYVGLPLAVEFSKKYKTIGFDIDQKRIKELEMGYDKTDEILKDELENSPLSYSNDVTELQDCNIYIVTVPTPIDKYNKPDLTALQSASEMIGKLLCHGDIIIYESTVYPGCTEEECVPVLEKNSGLKYITTDSTSTSDHQYTTALEGFYCGYSPERINPGDKVNTLTKIKKVTSGSTPEIGHIVDKLYNSIITAGTHLAPSIKVAEASKAIENAQRDVNISFVNELALIFDKIGIDTNDVLDAAGTKWNFLKYKPGLVGGHCISVDPYYLVHKAESLGYYPEVILSGRRVNSRIHKFVADKIIKLMIQKGIRINGAKILILGITFKENCPDIRNTKVIGIYEELFKYGVEVDIVDPIADKKEVNREFGINLLKYPELGNYSGVILAVPHDKILENYKTEFKSTSKNVMFDLKAALTKEQSDARL